MVKHVILWNLKDEYTEAEKLEIKKNIKSGLEGLCGKIPGLTKIQVNIDPLPTSNADLMLDSEFESFDSLKAYATHPLHVDVADKLVRPHTKSRVCMDFSE